MNFLEMRIGTGYGYFYVWRYIMQEVKVFFQKTWWFLLLSAMVAMFALKCIEV